MTLQIRSFMGHNEEVLERVEVLREKLAELPKEHSDNETVEPWNVQEVLLDTGRRAARELGQSQKALDLNAAVLQLNIERGELPSSKVDPPSGGVVK